MVHLYVTLVLPLLDLKRYLMETFDTFRKFKVTKIYNFVVIFVQIVTLLGNGDYFLLPFKLFLGGIKFYTAL